MAEPRVDPITLEIIRGSLASAIRDMELLMERCAMSPFIKEKKDTSSASSTLAGASWPATSRAAVPACSRRS